MATSYLQPIAHAVRSKAQEYLAILVQHSNGCKMDRLLHSFVLAALIVLPGLLAALIKKVKEKFFDAPKVVPPPPAQGYLVRASNMRIRVRDAIYGVPKVTPPPERRNLLYHAVTENWFADQAANIWRYLYATNTPLRATLGRFGFRLFAVYTLLSLLSLDAVHAIICATVFVASFALFLTAQRKSWRKCNRIGIALLMALLAYECAAAYQDAKSKHAADVAIDVSKLGPYPYPPPPYTKRLVAIDWNEVLAGL